MKKKTLALLAAATATALGFQAADASAKTHHHKKKAHHHKHASLNHHHNAMAAHQWKAGSVVAHIYIGSQHMTVDVNGGRMADWAVSTARAGYHTPRGTYGAIRMARVYYSKKYDNSPMPNSVFFHGGYAIHGTYHISGLGHPASHGCVRLLPAHAAALYSLVQEYGMGHTRIVITN